MPAILIVDDEPHIRLLLEQALEAVEDEGVTLLKTSNGVEALDIIKVERPALIFLDVMMPKLNGFDVCQTVKHGWPMHDLYVVLLTAKGQEFDRQRGVEVGADEYITKPFDPDEMLAIARRVLVREG